MAYAHDGKAMRGPSYWRCGSQPKYRLVCVGHSLPEPKNKEGLPSLETLR
ncbi:hypothetical protein SAMN05216569_1305 [Pseudoxanthomonas sp. CF125]|nr:hypothetical protein SAMN05216569_1305 [Pseudoxanthomonas sp. CF125]